MDSSALSRGLPRRLLNNPAVVRALATRTFSTVFTAAKAAGLSFNAIAAATGMKAERISLIARGKARVTSIETIERIGDGLRIPGAMLGLATRPWEGGKGTKPAREDESMYRRELLRTVLAAG